MDVAFVGRTRSQLVPPFSLGLIGLLLTCSKGEAAWRAGFVDAPVAAVAALATGRVESIKVKEGDHVVRGQLLAQIDAREREVAVAEAEANLERSQQALTETEQNLEAARPTARGTEADVARARAALVQAQIDFRRAQKLVKGGAAPTSTLDGARSQLDQARAVLESAKAGHVGTRGRIGAAAAAVANARWAVRSSQSALDLARVQLAQAQVLSPFDGRVVERDIEEGEWATPGMPIVTVENLERVWVRIDMGERDFRGLHLGQAAQVRLIASPENLLRGHVAEVGAEGTFAINRDVKRGTPDLRTFLVRIALDEREGALPGMTAEVHLLSGPATGGP